jgi:hypothetical protein
MGFKVDQKDIHSSLKATACYVKDHGLRPYYLLSDDARKEFPEVTGEYDSVVVGLAPEQFNYQNINKAFQ